MHCLSASMARSTRVLGTIVFLQIILGCSLVQAGHDSGDWCDYSPGLSVSYYEKSCPPAADIVSSFIKKTIKEDRTFSGAIVRLFFHDCFVHGCDASVLIESTPHNMAERDALPNNNSLRGFDKIDELKAQLEAACPGVVSCADLIALATRDAVVEVGGEPWPVGLGRKDGMVSVATDANNNIPSPQSNFSTLVSAFAVKGLSPTDLVLLSGAHTIGRAHCRFFVNRLYNSDAPGAVGGTDPDLNPQLAKSLRRQCPPPITNQFDIALNDPTKGGFTFDNNYYSRLLQNKGVFRSDAALLTDSSAVKLVKREANNPSPFGYDFGIAMIKMGNIPIPDNDPGNVRLKCFKFNTD